MLDSYAKFIERNKLKVLLFSILLVLAPLSNINTLGLSNDMRVYFSDESPYTTSLDLLEETFGQQDNLLIYIEDRSGNIFNTKTLSAIAELTESLWQTPFSIRVDSLTNFQRTTAKDDELIVDFLAEYPETLSDQELNDIQQYATHEPALINRLISKDGKATAINITFSLPSSNPDSLEDLPTIASIEAKNFVDQQVNLLRKENPQLTMETGGVIASNLAMATALENDVTLLVPLSYIVLLVIIYLFTNSLAAVVLTLAIVSLSIIHTFGLFSFFGQPITPTTGFVPTAIMAIAIADAIHYLSGYFQEIRDGKNHNNAIINSIVKNAKPIVITSLTTIIGLLGLNFSEAPPYRDMGNMMAIGVLSALFLTLTFLPALLFTINPLKTKEKVATSIVLRSIAVFVTERPKQITMGTLILLIIAGIGFTNNQVSERWYLYFDDEFEVTRSLEKIDKNLSGIHNFHYTLDSGIENGINNPSFWVEVESFSNWFRSQEGVVQVDSFSDVLKSINRGMNNDDAHFYRLPDTREIIAQYLLVYELSLPNGLGIDSYINTNRSAVRFSVTLKKSNSKQMIALDQAAQNWISKNSNTIMPTNGSGMDLMFSRMAQENSISLIYGTVVILILVSIILIIALQSVPLGLISLIPNIAPAILAYGAWGYFNGVIDLSSSIVICISLGIVVDDTVHFLSKYQHARNLLGLGSRDAVKHSFETVGNALIITTLALVSCFLITVFSQFQPSSNLGILLALTLGSALLIDLLLLPSLLLLFDNNQNKRRYK